LLRSNLFPTRTTLSMGRPNAIKSCRRCEAATESPAHISGCCPFVKNARIKRHNKILDQLRLYVGKYGWTTYLEPRLVGKDGALWKPDLIFKKGKKIAVVDVTVRYETEYRSLEMAWDEKTAKYQHLAPEIMELTGGIAPQFFGFVVGARGKWLEMNNRLMKFLGIERFQTFAQKISRLALALTLDILQLFSDK